MVAIELTLSHILILLQQCFKYCQMFFIKASKGDADAMFKNLSVKKTWEQSSYPYLFFNEDGESFTTLGFCALSGKDQQ